MLERYYHIDQCTGISVLLQGDGAADIGICSVSKKHNLLQIDKVKTGITEIKRLPELLPDKELISLNICGKGVLVRQISKEGIIDKSTFHRILPNAEINDFYVQHFVSGESSFVAAIRKTEADHLIGQLSGFGFKVLSLSLGPFPIHQVTDQLNIYDESFNINGHQVGHDAEGNWVSYQYKEAINAPFALKLGIDPIDDKAVLPYACAFQLIVADKLEPVAATIPKLQASYHATIEQRKIRALAFFLLAVFFIALLANYLLLTHLNAENINLENQLASTTRSTEDYNDINEQVTRKEGLLKMLGWDGGINKSLLIDQIAAVLPPEITWNEISVNPVDLQQSRLEKNLVFKNRRLRITGDSQRIIPVNEWIARIKTKAWVKSIQLESFVYNNEENTGRFDIEIDY